MRQVVDLLAHVRDPYAHGRVKGILGSFIPGKPLTWLFKMVNGEDFGTPMSDKHPTIVISRDGGSPVPPTSPAQVEEIGFGWYKVTISGEDTMCKVLLLIANADDCAQTDEVFYAGGVE